MTASPLTTPPPTTATAAPRVSDRGRWLPGYLALAVIWGSSFLFIKVGVRELHPLYLTMGRVACGALTLVVVLLALRLRLPRDVRLWGHLVIVGAFGVAIPFTLFGYGEQRISSVLAGLWNATTPLVALPVAVLVFRTEKMTIRRAVGLGLGFAGVAVILGVWQGVGGSSLTGQLMCFGAALCYGLAIPYQRRYLAARPEPGTVIAAGQLIAAAVVLAVVSPLIAGAPPSPLALSADVVASVVLLGAAGTGIAFVINFRVIRIAGASTSASVTYLVPVVATLIGIAVLGEEMAWYQPVGASIVLLGVAISQGARRSPRRVRAPAGDDRA